MLSTDQYLGEQDTTGLEAFSVLYNTGGKTKGVGNSGDSYSGMPVGCEFRASGSNPIYGSSDTVIPPSVSTQYFIRFV